MEVGGQHNAPVAFNPGKYPVPIAQEAGWASDPVWIGAENLAPTGIPSPDLPARSEPLYRLCHPGSFINVYLNVIGNVDVLVPHRLLLRQFR